jgi:putative transposase
VREADWQLCEGRKLPEGCKGVLEVSEATYHRWRAQFGGMKADDVKRLKELEVESAQFEADRGRSDAGGRGAEEDVEGTDERSSPRGCRGRRGSGVALPVGDGLFVSGLGVLGELALGSAALLAVEVMLASTGTAAGVAGFELDGPDLLRQGGREGVGVVLFADEQVPEQRGHLAGGRDDRDRMPTAGADTLVERAQRARRPHGGQRGLDEDVPDGGGAFFADVAGVTGPVAGLPHAGSRPR